MMNAMPPDMQDSFAADLGGADLRHLFAVAWRGKWAVAALVAIAAMTAAFVMSRVPPVYEASAKVLLDTRALRVANITDVVGALPVDNAVTASEMAVIRSEEVIGDVSERLSLAKLPGFGDPTPGLFALLRQEAKAAAPSLTGWLPDDQTPDGPEAMARAKLRDALIVSQEGRSYVIRIAIRAETPDLAASLANEVAVTYIDRQIASKRNATAEATGWLTERLDALKADTEAADAAIEAFKAGQAHGEGQGAAVTTQQIAEVNRALVSARASRAEAEARRDQIARLTEAKGKGAAADVLSSPLILSLRQQRAEVKRREAELATRYGAKHPKMVNVKAELRDLSIAISGEVGKIVAGLENDVAVAVAREETLAAELTGLEDRSVDLSRASVGLRQLEREAEASRRIYENFLARWKETSEAARLPQADARVISVATPPTASAAPRKGMIVALAGFGGGFVGLALIFFGELMANTFRTGAEAERALGISLLARLPRLGRGSRRKAFLDNLSRNPNSAYAEGVRGLRNALLLADSEGRPKSVMVTSAAPGEGKTATCLAIAHMSALMGKRAVVVECDLRRPRLASALGAKIPPNTPDLIGVMTAGAEIDDALIPFGPAGAFALPVAAPAPKEADILSSAAFSELVRRLSASFDIVLFDTPPVLAVSDAAAIGKAVDGFLFLARWNKTPTQAAEESLRLLRNQGGRPLGVALTFVDPKREAVYEYGGYRASVPDYSSYYA